MFGLFRPSCPCDSAAKTWIETRLRWLNEQFEDSAFSGVPVVLPTSHFFPDHYDGSEAAVRRMLTDLTVVFMGLGIFLANSPRAWRGQLSKWPGTTLNKPEYMSAPMYAYALAHLAWFRDEPRPAWAKHLHWHFRPEFKQALRYLLETGDSSFQPADTARARSEL